MILAFEVKRTR